MKKMKKILKNKKGFTLIEIIVVLVIIALLAAATIPAMIGFVNEARGKAYAAEARVGLVAAQATVTELVASGVDPGDIDLDVIKEESSFVNMVAEDVEGGLDAFTDITIDGNRVTGIVYTSTNDYVVTIEGGKTTVEKGGTSSSTPESETGGA